MQAPSLLKRKPPMVRKWPPKKRAVIVAYANEHGVSAASNQFGVNTSLVYKWRASAANVTNGKSAKTLRAKGKHAFTDAQKRLVLREAKDTTVKQASERFGCSTASIYEWRKTLRPARNKTSKATRTKRAKQIKQSTNGHSVFASVRANGLLAHEITQLRTQVTTLVDENTRLKDKLIQYVIHE